MPAAPITEPRPWQFFDTYTAWRRTKTVDLATRELHLLHGACGVADEIGEFFEVANHAHQKVIRTPSKKVIPIADYQRIHKEAGDILFYRDLAQDTLLNAWASGPMQQLAGQLPNVVEAFDERIAGPDDALVRYKLDELVVIGSRILGPVKKAVFYQVPLDHESLAKNLVYALFAVAYVVKWASSCVEWGDAGDPGSVCGVLRSNVIKLDSRYKDGFVAGGGDRTGKGE